VYKHFLPHCKTGTDLALDPDPCNTRRIHRYETAKSVCSSTDSYHHRKLCDQFKNYSWHATSIGMVSVNFHGSGLLSIASAANLLFYAFFLFVMCRNGVFENPGILVFGPTCFALPTLSLLVSSLASCRDS
jgi:hypothetical protein